MVNVKPNEVHQVLGKNMLADGLEQIVDLKKSHGCYIVDARNGDEYIDMFTFLASQALGLNHPKLTTPEFREKLADASVNKPSNSDIYSTELAEFVETFSRIAKPDHFKHLFFVEGGTLAVENGLKVAFDWKVQKNYEKGYKEEKGYKVLHFEQAFHGRSGYTLSLTNTDPVKVKRFPKFDWPRVTTPKMSFPVDEHIEEIKKLEEKAINEINEHIKNNPDDIAVIIIEPIQGEGGDNHFRKEFFLKLREIADQNDILLMFDEVQTGLGLTGKMWASEHYVMPDIISFGKKAQVCGIMVSDRIDDIKDNCFTTSSRINSTWGGNLVDMVRAQKILEVIEEDNLVENAAEMGEYLLQQLHELQKEYPELVLNVRGKGLMCAFELPTPEKQKEFIGKSLDEKVAFMGCGEKTCRFRPALIVTKDVIDEALKRMRKALSSM